MASMASIPEEQYPRSTFEPDAEYANGQVLPRAAGEFDHSDWQLSIALWFREHAGEWNLRVAPGQRIRVAAGNYRVPDVAVMDGSVEKEQVLTHPSLAVFEVLSPADTVQDLDGKLCDYAAMGIPHIWVVNPKTRRFRRYEDGSLRPADRFASPERGIDFAFEEIARPLQD